MEQPNNLEEYLRALKNSLQGATTLTELYKVIVNDPFVNRYMSTTLDIGIIVLLIVNVKTQMIDRIALSNTELADGAVKMSALPFKAIKIPLGFTKNYIAKAIKTNSPQFTEDWQYLFIPALTPEQARFNQAGAGIASSSVYPLKIPGGGAIIFSCFQYLANMTDRHTEFMAEYTKLVADAINKLNI